MKYNFVYILYYYLGPWLASEVGQMSYFRPLACVQRHPGLDTHRLTTAVTCDGQVTALHLAVESSPRSRGYAPMYKVAVRPLSPDALLLVSPTVSTAEGQID